ncbi:MAG: prepilin-type N-terminal cleavage/methylation domain-containing protein [Candidatus Omnitrophica bacterium]|nr:prepilin-type N-terminal cleavage/methylation domain-containing protein [Candidatus Omnitrophota bacterium]
MYRITNRNKRVFTPLERKRNPGGRSSFLTGPVRKRFSNGAGFTLIEMLVVLSMFALIGLTLFSTLNNGIKIWQRLNQTVKQEDVNLFFDRFSTELRNSFKFKTIEFRGNKEQINFPTLAASSLQGSMVIRGISEVSYSFDKAGQELSKELRTYSQIYKGESGSNQKVLKDIDSLKFTYYYYDEDIEEYAWLEDWQSQNLPLAVRIELGFYIDADEYELQTITRTIDIPVSQS